MRKTISDGSLDLRTKFIVIILFICFEIYHGNSFSAANQIRAGSAMIEEQCRKRNIENETSKPPPLIDDELLEAFAGLEIQSTTHSGYKMNGSQRYRLSCRQNVLAKMPEEFATVKEARTPLGLIIKRQIHWRVENTPFYDATMLPHFHEAAYPFDNNASYQERARRFLEYASWERAYQPLLARARKTSDRRLWRVATTVKIFYLASYLALFSAIWTYEDNYYNQTAVLAEIISLVKSLYERETEDDDSGFSMDADVVMSLSLVAWRYRHRALRQEAIRLLLASLLRGGLWDGMFTGRTAQWVAEIEEEGLGLEEHVPHERSTDVEVLDVDLSARTATLQAFLKDTNSPDGLVKENARIKC